jgi:drug/metabolite transporter (DMT)-like permease
MDRPIVSALLFGGVAAIGNAIYVYAYRKSDASSSPLLFMACGVAAALVALLLCLAFFRPSDPGALISRNGGWIALSGIGTAITYVGFFFLYTRSGAISYTLYAVLSLLTTTIGVGVIVMRERFNLWHGLAALAAVAALGFFTVGQAQPAPPQKNVEKTGN